MAYYMEGDGPILSGSNNNGFGNGWEGLIGLALVASLFGGGWGFGGGNHGGYGAAATQADLSAGFANSSILSSLNDIKLTQGSNLNFVNQGFAGLNNVLTTGFAANAAALADCCCTTKSLILENRYLNERQTCDLITNQNANTQRILDYLCAEKISGLQAENVALKGQLSNYAQTNAIVSALKPTPVPSYSVPNPNCCYNPCGTCVGVQ